MIPRQIKVLRDVLRDQEIATPTVIWAMALTVLLAALEGAGLGMLLPLLTFVEKGPDAAVDASGSVALIADVVEWLGLPLTFGTLVMLTAAPLILRQIVMYKRFLVVAGISHQGTQALRRKAISAGLRSDLRFFIGRKHGDFPNAMLTEPQNAGTISYVGIGIVLHLLVIAAYFAMMFYVSWQLTALVVPVVLILGALVRRYSRKGRLLTLDVKDRSAALYQSVSELVRGIRLIRMRAYENEAVARLMGLVDGITASRIAYDRVKATVDSGGPLILTVGIFLLLYLAVSKMDMKLAELGFFLFVVMRLQQVVTQLNQDRMAFVRQLVSIEYMREFIVDAAAHRPVVAGTRPFALDRELRFEEVSFRYEGSRGATPVLNNLSFRVGVGQTVAIVGRSGVGKSTAIDLLMRHFQPQQGRILIDDQPIDSFELPSLRRGIGVVTQDTFLFHETVRHNLCFGLIPAPNDDSLWAALEQAHACGFVRMLPDGLDTVLGEGGADLSGGQRQRLSLARALVQSPQLLVLDEPTSALDSETEAAIQDSLSRLHGRMTILVIAHRLATIIKADRIMVMDGGTIVADGDHGTLLRKNSTYHTLFKAQTGEIGA